jgi:hypothetical protein
VRVLSRGVNVSVSVTKGEKAQLVAKDFDAIDLVPGPWVERPIEVAVMFLEAEDLKRRATCRIGPSW